MHKCWDLGCLVNTTSFQAADEESTDMKCFDCSGSEYEDCSTSDVFFGDSDSCQGWCQKVTKCEIRRALHMLGNC